MICNHSLTNVPVSFFPWLIYPFISPLRQRSKDKTLEDLPFASDICTPIELIDVRWRIYWSKGWVIVIQAMACCLLGANPSPKLMLTLMSIDPTETFDISIKITSFFRENLFPISSAKRQPFTFRTKWLNQGSCCIVLRCLVFIFNTRILNHLMMMFICICRLNMYLMFCKIC